MAGVYFQLHERGSSSDVGFYRVHVKDLQEEARENSGVCKVYYLLAVSAAPFACRVIAWAMAGRCDHAQGRKRRVDSKALEGNRQGDDHTGNDGDELLGDETIVRKYLMGGATDGQ